MQFLAKNIFGIWPPLSNTWGEDLDILFNSWQIFFKEIIPTQASLPLGQANMTFQT